MSLSCTVGLCVCVSFYPLAVSVCFYPFLLFLSISLCFCPFFLNIFFSVRFSCILSVAVNFCLFWFVFVFFCNLGIFFVLVLLSTNVQRFTVSRVLDDFFRKTKYITVSIGTYWRYFCLLCGALYCISIAHFYNNNKY